VPWLARQTGDARHWVLVHDLPFPAPRFNCVNRHRSDMFTGLASIGLWTLHWFEELIDKNQKCYRFWGGEELPWVEDETRRLSRVKRVAAQPAAAGLSQRVTPLSTLGIVSGRGRARHQRIAFCMILRLMPAAAFLCNTPFWIDLSIIESVGGANPSPARYYETLKCIAHSLHLCAQTAQILSIDQTPSLILPIPLFLLTCD